MTPMHTEPQSRTPPFPIGRILALGGGVLLVGSVFFLWFTATIPGGGGGGTALQLGPLLPELGVLPALGLGLIVGALFQWSGFRLPSGSRIPGVLALLAGVVAIAVSVESVARLNAELVTLFGAGVWVGLGVGWFFAVGGSFLGVIAGVSGLLRSRGIAAA